jgi:hypothetical protein
MMKYIIVGIDESTVNKDDCLVMTVTEPVSSVSAEGLRFSSILTRFQGIRFLLEASNEAAKGIDPKAVAPADLSPGQSHVAADNRCFHGNWDYDNRRCADCGMTYETYERNRLTQKG